MPPDINLILRIRKLERLATNNSNPHEADAARVKANALRAKLSAEEQTAEQKLDWGKVPKTMPNINLWPQSRAPKSRPPSKSKWEFLIEELQQCMPRLKASGQLFAADLAAQFYSKGQLTEKQWACVNQLIEEADEPFA
jgi:hypothetical protein